MELEALKLKLENYSLRAQIMQQNVAVAEYQKLLVEAGQLEALIKAIEEKKNEKQEAHPDIDPDYPFGTHAVDPIK